jgi:hypothetical protein
MRGISRRGFLTGTAILGTTTVGITLATNKASATATIDSGDFAVSDKSQDITGKELQDVLIESDINYSFDANVSIGEVVLSVALGASEQSAQIIAEQSTNPGKKSVDSDATLTGSLFDAGDYDLSLMQIDEGERTVRVTAVAEMIIKRNQSVVATDKLTDTFEVTITKDKVTLNGEFSGTGNVQVNTEPA